MRILLNDNIDILNLSTRATNALKNNNIYTVSDFVEYPNEDFVNMKNLGRKTINELLECLDNLIENGINAVGDPESSYIAIKEFIYIDGNKYEDVELKALGLSVRAYNGLSRSGYRWFSEIVNLDEVLLLTINNMGTKSVGEILEVINNTILVPVELSDTKDVNVEILCNLIFNHLSEKMSINGKEHYNAMMEFYQTYLQEQCVEEVQDNILSDLQLMNLLQQSIYMKNLLKKHVFDCIDKSLYVCSFNSLYTQLPTVFKNVRFVEELLQEMSDECKIKKCDENSYVVVRLSFAEGMRSVLSEREYHVLIHRIQNFTLEEIGEGLNITREWVRQIESKAIQNLENLRCRFEEDIYKDIYIHYDISIEEFNMAFKKPQAYMYLQVRYPNIHGKLYQKKPLNEVLVNSTIPEYMRKSLEKAVYKDYVRIGNEYIPCNRSEITYAVLRTYASDTDITYDEFVTLYFDTLEDIGKRSDEKLGLMDRGYENKLAASNMILWKYGKKLRYYNSRSYDYTRLFDTIKLNQYSDVEYSSKKFYKLYPEIMEEYNIQDEYELHNLLKKIYKDEDNRISFKRMPNIEFGRIDRYKQMLNLILALAPISNTELALAYEEEYGVSAPTVLANYLKEFDMYFHEGIYKIDVPMLPEIVADKLRTLLGGEFYLVDEIKNIYHKEFPNSDLKLINPLSIKRLGFKVYSTYAISDKFASATEYFNSLLTTEDIFDMVRIPQSIRQLLQFMAQLYKLKSNYEIVEFSPGKYISSSRLERNGINKDVIREFQKKIFEHAGSGKYFTMQSLKSEGFSHDMEEYGFENWFYTSLLAECKDEVTFRRVGGNKLFMVGKKKVLLEEFIESIVFLQDNLFIDIYDLRELLEIKYGIAVSIYKLIEIAKDTSLYFDVISEKIYAEYDVYYEEV